jgi:murein DD-endopeptidase MepM/ murein hydrolase activator NlpD
MSWLRKHCKLITFLVATVTIAGTAFTQDKIKQLENQRIQIEKSIEYTEVLLDNTRENKVASLDELALLNEQILNRQKLIDNYVEERDSRMDTIFQLLFKLDEMAHEVDALKEEYARMIFCAWKNNNAYQRMFYVLASDDFNQAFQRLNYFKVYANTRNQQLQLINEAEAGYSANVDILELSVDTTEKLIAQLESEKALLEKEKQRKDLAVENLRRQEKELVSNQNKRKKKAAELKQQIEIFIAENLHVPKTPSVAVENATMSKTPEEELLSTEFLLNRGHLPWPLERGVVSTYFGEHKHPDLEGIKVRNNGINIITQEGSRARAVFDGEVTRVMALPNFNNIVIVRHGNFLTVYSNLEEVFVKTGSYVVTKENIGVVFTDREQSKTELHFEIWEGKTLLDPVKWLASDWSSELLHGLNH